MRFTIKMIDKHIKQYNSDIREVHYAKRNTLTD